MPTNGRRETTPSATRAPVCCFRLLGSGTCRLGVRGMEASVFEAAPAPGILCRVGLYLGAGGLEPLVQSARWAAGIRPLRPSAGSDRRRHWPLPLGSPSHVPGD